MLLSLQYSDRGRYCGPSVLTNMMTVTVKACVCICITYTHTSHDDDMHCTKQIENSGFNSLAVEWRHTSCFVLNEEIPEGPQPFQSFQSRNSERRSLTPVAADSCPFSEEALSFNGVNGVRSRNLDKRALNPVNADGCCPCEGDETPSRGAAAKTSLLPKMPARGQHMMRPRSKSME